MQPNHVRKFKTLTFICLFTSLAGLIYQLVAEEHIDFNSVALGFPLGLVFGIMELFVFPKSYRKFQKWSFTKLLIFKSLLYTVTIFIVTVVL
ncbi:MAG: hypothetical protein ACXWCZ_07485, partial [Flavisolibacter sp.]